MPDTRITTGRAVAVVVVVVLAMSAGCAPAVIWSGHTADRRHTIEIAKRGDLQWVVVDGQRRGAYRAIAAWSIASSGSRFVFAAKRGAGWTVVGAGPAESWEGIGEIVVAGERTAYVAERAGRWHVVVDGVAGPGWEAVLAGTLRFAGGRAVYAARDADGAHVVIDGVIGARYDGVGQLTVSADGAHVAYAARRGDEARVIVDGREGRAHGAVRALVLADATAVYAARAGDAWDVRVGERVYGPYAEVREIVTHGARAAWVATEKGEDVVVCDGVPVGRARRIDAVRIARACEVVYVTLGDGARVVDSGANTRGAAGPAYDAIEAIAVSGGGRVAYTGRRGDAWEVIVDGEKVGGGTWASAPVWAADGRVGFVVRRGDRMIVTVGGVEHAFDLVLDGTLAFAGGRWAVIAGDLRKERLFFVIDGVVRVPLAMKELYSAAAQQAAAPMGDRGEVLRAWAEAEAAKAR